MSVKLQKMILEPWTSRRSGSLVLVPNKAVLTLKDELGDLDVAGLVPPYRPNDWTFNATAAAMIRGAFMQHRILAPIPATKMGEAREYLQTFAEAGFDAFILPEAIQGYPIQHKAGNWHMSGVLSEHHWYHLAGGRGIDIPGDVPGRWTWSEEGM